jgi:hypothetical protein
VNSTIFERPSYADTAAKEEVPATEYQTNSCCGIGLSNCDMMSVNGCGINSAESQLLDIYCWIRDARLLSVRRLEVFHAGGEILGQFQ